MQRLSHHYNLSYLNVIHLVRSDEPLLWEIPHTWEIPQSRLRMWADLSICLFTRAHIHMVNILKRVACILVVHCVPRLGSAHLELSQSQQYLLRHIQQIWVSLMYTTLQQICQSICVNEDMAQEIIAFTSLLARCSLSYSHKILSNQDMVTIRWRRCLGTGPKYMNYHIGFAHTKICSTLNPDHIWVFSFRELQRPPVYDIDRQCIVDCSSEYHIISKSFKTQAIF